MTLREGLMNDGKGLIARVCLIRIVGIRNDIIAFCMCIGIHALYSMLKVYIINSIFIQSTGSDQKHTGVRG
jgi:hypothetical protein